MDDILTFTKDATRWLSNMTFVDIEHDGIVYVATENFYQAMKYNAEDYGNLPDGSTVNIREFISKLPPTKSKKFSRENPMTNEFFEFNKVHIMLTAQRKKFAQEPFRSKLLATGNAHLEEGNWWGDSFWGVDIKTRKGFNHLGKIIMSVRDELKLQEKLNA